MFSSSELKRSRADVFLSRTPKGLSGFPSTITELSSMLAEVEILGGAGVTLLCGLAVFTLHGLSTNSTFGEVAGSAFVTESWVTVSGSSQLDGVTAEGEETEAGGEGGGFRLCDLCQAGAIVKRTLV